MSTQVETFKTRGSLKRLCVCVCVSVCVPNAKFSSLKLLIYEPIILP